MDEPNTIELTWSDREHLARALQGHLETHGAEVPGDWERGFDAHVQPIAALAHLSEIERARIALMLAPSAGFRGGAWSQARAGLEVARQQWSDVLPFDFLSIRYGQGRQWRLWWTRLSAEADLCSALGGDEAVRELLQHHKPHLERWREIHHWLWAEPGAVAAELAALTREPRPSAGQLGLVRTLASGVAELSQMSAQLLKAGRVTAAETRIDRRDELERVVAQTLGYQFRPAGAQPELAF